MVCAKTRSELFETHHSPLSPVRTRRLRTRQHMQHTNGRTENRVSDARLRKCQHRSADHYHTHTPPCYPRARSERDRRSTIRSFTQLTRRPTSSHVRMHAVCEDDSRHWVAAWVYGPRRQTRPRRTDHLRTASRIACWPPESISRPPRRARQRHATRQRAPNGQIPKPGRPFPADRHVGRSL